MQDDFSAAFSRKIKIFAPAPLHGVSNARARKRPTTTATPPLLIPGFQLRSNSSTASTLSGAKMRWLDSDFGHRSGLNLLSFLGGFVGRAMVRVEKSPRATFSP
jgi:hypothetical protein